MRVFRRVMLGGGIDIDIDALPDTQKLYYKATNRVAPRSLSLGAPLITNKWDATTGEGIIVCINDIKEIGYDAFYYSISLTNITIPNSVTSIGSRAFYNCSSLTSVVIPDNVTEIGSDAFYSCHSLTSVTIGNSVTSIEQSTFYNCSSLTSITIPDSVTKIGDGAFYNCSSLTSVTIGNSVTSIGYSTFRNCTSMQYYDFSTHESVPILSSTNAFSSIPSTCKIIVPDALYDEWIAATNWSTYANDIVKLEDYDPNSYYIYYTSSDGNIVTPYNRGAFGANIISNTYENGKGIIKFDDDVTKIGEAAFYNCSSLTSVTIPNSVTSIENYVFSGCSSLTSITIGNSVTSIGTQAFYGCESLTSITIPDSVTSIGESAFNGCSSLTSVTIPDSVTSIGQQAFYGCESLTSVYCKPTTPPTGGIVMFNSNATDRIIYVPTASVDAYKSATNWSSYADAIEGYEF